MAVGFTPMRAAVIVLLANTAPVAFGAVGTPIVTAGSLTGIDYHEIGAYVGHQTPLAALFVPFILVLLADGWRGLKETWPAAHLRRGVLDRAVGQRHLDLGRADRHRGISRGIAAAVVLLRSRQPRGTAAARERLL